MSTPIEGPPAGCSRCERPGGAAFSFSGRTGRNGGTCLVSTYDNGIATSPATTT